jgi:hypothetical protein
MSNCPLASDQQVPDDRRQKMISDGTNMMIGIPLSNSCACSTHRSLIKLEHPLSSPSQLQPDTKGWAPKQHLQVGIQCHTHYRSTVAWPAWSKFSFGSQRDIAGWDLYLCCFFRNDFIFDWFTSIAHKNPSRKKKSWYSISSLTSWHSPICSWGKQDEVNWWSYRRKHLVSLPTYLQYL